MGATYKEIGKVKVVTDTETGMYKVGEVEASLDSLELRRHIKRYGHKELLANLAYMQFQVYETLRSINSESSDNEAVQATSQ